MLRLTLCLVALLGPGIATATLVPGDQDRTLEFGGLTRTYHVHVPPGYTGTTPVPLVLNFHGLSSFGLQQATLSKILPVADSGGFIVVHPDGIDKAWNAGVCCGNKNIDDVGFVRAMVASIETEANIDRTRVYATGLSNGGAMSQLLACQAADLFAAAAPMAFPLSLKPLSRCQPVRSIPVLTFMGLTDVLVSYAGGTFASAPDTFAYWHDVDGCSGSEPDQMDTSGASRCEMYTTCRSGVQVGLCSITARSFGGTPFDGHILYLNSDYNLAEVAWAFLSRFRLPTMLAGTGTVKLGRARGTLEGLTWFVTLGNGTWAAEDTNRTSFTGTLVRRGRRKGVLTLADDSRPALFASLAGQVSPVVGGAVTVDLPRRGALVARLDERGVLQQLIGRFKLTGGTPGAKHGLVTVRLLGSQ